MLLLKTVILAILDFSAAAPLPEPKVVGFSLTPHVGSFQLSQLPQLRKRKYEHLVKRETTFTETNQNDITNTLYSSLEDRVIAYTLDIGLGLPGQTYSMILDTGSSYMWVGNSSKITEKPYLVATDTAANISGPIQYITYGIGQVAIQWGTTTMTLLENKPIENVPFSVAFRTAKLQSFAHVSGLIGLAYTERNHTNLPQLLKDNGLTKSVSYSLSLGGNTNNNDAGNNGSSILFGGLDHSRYTGPLTSVPRVNVSGSTRRYLAVNLTKVRLPNQDISTTVALPILLDSGATYTYLPSDIYNSIISYLGVDPAVTQSYGQPMLDIEKYGDYEVEFEFSGAAKFKVKAKDLAVPVNGFNLHQGEENDNNASKDQIAALGSNDGTHWFKPDPASVTVTGNEENQPTPSQSAAGGTGIDYSHSKYVPLGLSDTGYDSSKSPMLILGERALRAAYVVFDLESDRIAIAQASENKGDSAYDTIQNGVIPGAVVV